MKSFINILVLLPILILLSLLLINRHLLWINETISIFGLTEINIPIISFSIIFFVWYIITIYIYLRLSNVVTWFKNNRLESQVDKLKSKLYEERPQLVEDLKKEFTDNLELYKEIREKEINSYKKENEKLMSNLSYDVKTIKEKIEKINN